jgi:hypothetical protein
MAVMEYLTNTAYSSLRRIRQAHGMSLFGRALAMAVDFHS